MCTVFCWTSSFIFIRKYQGIYLGRWEVEHGRLQMPVLVLSIWIFWYYNWSFMGNIFKFRVFHLNFSICDFFHPHSKIKYSSNVLLVLGQTSWCSCFYVQKEILYDSYLPHSSLSFMSLIRLKMCNEMHIKII